MADVPDSIHKATPSADDLEELLGGYVGQQPGEVVETDDARSGAAEAIGFGVADSRTTESARRRVSAPVAAPRVDFGQLATWWWLPTLLIPMFGGMAAYYALRDKRPLAAHVLLIIGLSVGVVASIVFVTHVRDLAAWTTSTQNNSVIPLPSTTINR